MSAGASSDPIAGASGGISRTLLLTMATAAGVAVANIYYNQPLLADMARDLKVTDRQIGWVATATQIGYAVGMPVFVPLGDLMDRRRLITSMFLLVAAALILVALSTGLGPLVAASFLLGLTSVIAQVLIPFAADLATPSEQGKTIGSILSGVLIGILLARTVSGIVAADAGWRTMYWAAAAGSLVLSGLLHHLLPSIRPQLTFSYPEIMRSLGRLFRDLAKLRQVGLVAAMFFAAFSAFWTTLIFFLETPVYRYGSQTAGLFGLLGAAGALVAPAAGRLSDRHSPRYVVRIAIAVAAGAFVIFWSAGTHLWGLVIGVLALDAGVQAAQVANQSRVLALRPDARSRINTLYMIMYFGGGSVGSIVGTLSWAHLGWPGVCMTGLVSMAIAALALLARRPDPVLAAA